MQIASVLNHYLDPMIHAPHQELKLLKAPACDQDVRRFESVLNGEGAFQPKTIDLIMPATAPNAIENMGHTLVHRVSTIKQSMDHGMKRINEVLDKLSSKDFKIVDALRLTQEVYMFSIQNTMVTKIADKTGEGLKMMIRHQ